MMNSNRSFFEVKMSTATKLMLPILLLAMILVVSSSAVAGTLIQVEPHLVFGQPSFACNSGGLGPSSLCHPHGVAVDSAGNVYIADRGNNRVLEYDTPATTDMVADRVFGQPDFVTIGCNTSGRSASTLCSPTAVAVDSDGTLYIADDEDNRILAYFNPLMDAVADRVIGQPDFTAGACNGGTWIPFTQPTASLLCGPTALAADGAGHLYVADNRNFRVLQYISPMTTDTVADRVFGQANFTTRANCGAVVRAGFLCGPYGVAVDGVGDHLYVADTFNQRILVYDSPVTSDALPDQVLGAPDFSTAGSFFNPLGIAVDPDGNLAIANTSFEVLGFENPLTFDAVAELQFGGFVYYPLGLAADGAGNFYIANEGSNSVLEYDRPFHLDRDGDGLPDWRDTCPDDPLNDADGDGVCGNVDTCPVSPPALGLDADGNGCTDTIQGLKDYVVYLHVDIPGLQAKLDEAQKALDRDNIKGAVNKLNDFIKQVQGLVYPPSAERLIAYANNVIAVITR